NSGFKAVFGDRANKDVVMSVINMLLPDGKRVEDILYAPTEHQGQLESNKEFRYDFMCRGTDGSFFIVEVQTSPEKFWFKRCVSYASRVYDRQNSRGGEYDVPPVYLIGLMGIDVKHADPVMWKDRYVSEYSFREKTTNELQDDTIFIIFAELRRFHQKMSLISKWFYIFALKNRIKRNLPLLLHLISAPFCSVSQSRVPTLMQR
ncbi:MAG: PD-(D/E)XK nuclease family transposase, partial [Bacteroides sp.]|nr:PD-(D/E)XK nuclease family transposase [Bacteroides sp.]